MKLLKAVIVVTPIRNRDNLTDAIMRATGKSRETVTEFTDVEAAKTAISRDHPDCVVLDCRHELLDKNACRKLAGELLTRNQKQSTATILVLPTEIHNLWHRPGLSGLSIGSVGFIITSSNHVVEHIAKFLESGITEGENQFWVLMREAQRPTHGRYQDRRHGYPHLYSAVRAVRGSL